MRTIAGVTAILLTVAAGGAAGSNPEPFLDVTGAKHLPLDVGNDMAVVLFFVAADCPIANYYSSEIASIVKDHTGKSVRFYAVHVDPDLTPKAAAKHAADYGLPCPVLIDAKHRLVKATGATVTPEAAVLTAGGKVVYLGRIDDTYLELGRRRVEPGRRDLRDALTAVLAGKPVKEPRTKAIGCFIPDLP